MDAVDNELLFIGPFAFTGNHGCISLGASRRQPSPPLGQGTPGSFVFAIICVWCIWSERGTTVVFTHRGDPEPSTKSINSESSPSTLALESWDFSAGMRLPLCLCTSEQSATSDSSSVALAKLPNALVQRECRYCKVSQSFRDKEGSRRAPYTNEREEGSEELTFRLVHGEDPSLSYIHLPVVPGPAKTFTLTLLFIPQFAFLTTSIEEIKKNQVAMVFSSIHPTIRTVQAVCALIALITTAGGYLELSNGQLSSAAAIYAEIANYSAMLCGLFYAVGLGVFKNHVRTPTVVHQRLVDGLLVVALVIAGAVHLNSEAVRDCTSINSMFIGIHGKGLFSCSKMTTGIVLTFVTAALFLATLVWSYMTASTATPANEEEPSAAAAMGYAEAGTPGLKVDLIDSEHTELSAKRLHTLRLARRSGRVLQLVTSVAALVTTVAGYRHYYTGQYVSVSATTAILITYTGVVYSFWQVMAVESFQLCRAPKVASERFVDGVLAVALVVAGSVFATSSRVKNCDELNDKFAVNHGSDLFRCGAMDSGVVFSYVAVAMFLITFALSFAYGKSADMARNTHTTTEDNVQESQA